jgi:hypothetical protein
MRKPIEPSILGSLPLFKLTANLIGLESDPWDPNQAFIP